MSPQVGLQAHDPVEVDRGESQGGTATASGPATGASECDHEQEDDVAMAGAMRKMAVYLGLVEDDRYERYDTYPDDYPYEDEVQRGGDDRPAAVQERDEDADPSVPAPRPATTVLERRTTDLARITTARTMRHAPSASTSVTAPL
jgi:hypothetical protein